MINGGYLIPANTKKGQLLFGWFTPTDLILFGVGVSLSILLLLIVGTNSTLGGIICLLPGLICAFLVMPVPNYRNVRTFFKSMREFYSGQRQYKWKGWCFNNGQSRK
jgi:hypothetical protein